MPDHEARRMNYQHEYMAHRTPTLVGCAIAIRKDFFFAIGGFDDDMKIWGAENIELGFRAWLCGGQVISLFFTTRNLKYFFIYKIIFCLYIYEIAKP